MATILVIDDDAIVRDALSIFLVRAGHKVLTAADGLNGLQVFKNNFPDLVVLDRNLPAMSGAGVLSHIRKISTTVSVLVLSGYNAREDVGSCLRNGANIFLSKGDGLSLVLAEIDRLVCVQRKEEPHPGKAVKQAESPTVKTASGPVSGRVLIVDDDAETRMVLRRFLSSLFCETLEAAGGTEALELARAKRPDIILLDINMPKKDGVEVLRELSQEMPETGFIMITGNEDDEVARECLELGAFDYVSKPVNLATLCGIIKSRLSLQK
ncbi:MAG: hypothetical protein A2270_08645 [Elusimicrobia bacterium RIFOXYA12_FULL_51_18]|nr:MAG: hypothetical protein A2270_08645 [Elusimicrobia bacterium RIFOXYA12_FULL_51_18]OGS32190.1 MAG: hypothetical protein A2218_07175 [Elusimicrobia bacterium RIFOXYA2_FULL_53_38]